MSDIAFNTMIHWLIYCNMQLIRWKCYRNDYDKKKSQTRVSCNIDIYEFDEHYLNLYILNITSNPLLLKIIICYSSNVDKKNNILHIISHYLLLMCWIVQNLKINLTNNKLILLTIVTFSISLVSTCRIDDCAAASPRRSNQTTDRVNWNIIPFR